MKAKTRKTKRWGTGRWAEDAREIAMHVAQLLGAVDLEPGPDAREAIVTAALTSPLVRSEQQAHAVADGWEGRWHRDDGSTRIRVCESAGRQLAVLKGVLL
jgi:hypothetical protein